MTKKTKFYPHSWPYIFVFCYSFSLITLVYILSIVWFPKELDKNIVFSILFIDFVFSPLSITVLLMTLFRRKIILYDNKLIGYLMDGSRIVKIFIDLSKVESAKFTKEIL